MDANWVKDMALAIAPHLPPAGLDREAVGQMIAARAGVKLEVTTPRGVAVVEGAHQQLEELLGLITEGHQNILMVGPAGSGKTSLASAMAQALSVPFSFLSLSAGVTESHLFGRLLPSATGEWQYQPSPLVTRYSEGGVFLFDELDAADANLMVSVNAALANGHLSNPINGQTYTRHPDCIIMAAANTWGRGPSAQYVGRNALDAATLDRFVLATSYVDYDLELERRIMAAFKLSGPVSLKLEQWIADTRDKITRHRIQRVCSTRMVAAMARGLGAGTAFAALKGRYFAGWSDDEVRKMERES